MLPVPTLSTVNVPRLVILGCAALVTVAAVPDTLPETLITYVPLNRSDGTVPDVKLLAFAAPITVVKLPIPALTLPPLMLPVALTMPAVLMLAPVTLPVALAVPVTLIPVVDITKIFPTEFTVAKILPLGPAIAITVVPLVI